MKQTISYRKTVLNNGLRVISEKVSDVRSIAIGVWIDVGSRDEHPDENGLSHFVEHMLFKGTRTRTAKRIAASLESLGGSLNAFTSREQTCYHALILDEHLEEAVDVISDILTNSTLTPVNIKREKLVVLEEIKEINDTPSDHIHELFADSFWRGQPMGRPIMGIEANVVKFNQRRIRSFINKHYRTGRIVVAAAGNISHTRLVRLIKDKLDFSQGYDGRGEAVADPQTFAVKTYKNGSNQTHICLGFPGFAYDNNDKYALLVLHSYLGGGMSSVLFQKIREQKGMAYTVYTFPDFYRDCGVFGAYLATDRRFVRESIETILKELGRLKKSGLSKDKLDKIKDQSKGQLILGMESTNSRMSRLARQEILASKYVPYTESIKMINKINSVDIIAAARKVFDINKLTVTSLGSARKKDFDEIEWSIL